MSTEGGYDMNDQERPPRNPGLKGAITRSEESWGALFHGDDWPRVRDEIHAERARAKRRQESLPVKIAADTTIAVLVAAFVALLVGIGLSAFLFLRWMIGLV